MAFRHMFLKGSIAMFFVTPFMQGNTLMLVIYFYGIGIVNGIDFFTDIAEGYTVMVPVFTQCNMIILLNFSLCAMLYNIAAEGQRLKQGLFVIDKTIVAAIRLLLKRETVMGGKVFSDAFIELFQAKENPVS
jgi:hypothetical protein